MKTTTTSFLLFSFFFFAFSIKYSPVLAQTEGEPVRDIAGDKLRTGVNYYILPVARGMGGGVTLGANINSTTLCPLQVAQDRLEVSDGSPLTFTPVNPKKGIIRLSTDLNIKFDVVTICITSNVWRLDFDESSAPYFIATNGVEGNPGRETLSNWFNIRKDGDGDYKLVFCPGVCNFCRPICGDIGIYIGGDGVRRLALILGDDKVVRPFKIQFKRA